MAFFVCAAVPAHANIREGLVGWWKLDETSGATAIDWSGQNNNGTYNGTMAMPAVQCKRSGCRSFNGSSDYINLGNNDPLGITGNITLAAWVKVISFPSNGNLGDVVGKGFDGSNEGYFIRLWNNSGLLFQAGSYKLAGDVNYSASWTISGWNASEWHHVAGLYDGTNWQVYFDGVLKVSTAQASGPRSTSSSAYIGATSISGPIQRFLNGYIDDVRIYNRALSAQEVSDLYRAGTLIRNAVIRNARFNQ